MLVRSTTLSFPRGTCLSLVKGVIGELHRVLIPNYAEQWAAGERAQQVKGLATKHDDGSSVWNPCGGRKNQLPKPVT